MIKYAILDTNIFLHYDILSIDWCKELGSNEVEIIICSTVLRELDKKKIDGNKTISDRAEKNLSMIESYNSSKEEIRRNVKLSVNIKEPSIDWEHHGLDSSLNDDKILGFIIERKNSDDILITNDSTPRIKGKEMGIHVMKLNCDMLPNPKSEEHKEFERMKNKLRIFENRIPNLSIQLVSEETKGGLPKFAVKIIQNLSTEQIEEIISRKEQELSKISFPLTLNIMPFMIDKDGYQSDVKEYLNLYKTYLVDKNPIEQELSTVLKMDFILSCEQFPAEEIHCYIKFPDGFKICKQSDLPEIPSEPVVPKPRTFFEQNLRGIKFPTVPLRDTFPTWINPIPKEDITIDFNSNIIEIKTNKLNHGFEIPIDNVYVKMSSLDHAKNFEISCIIHASNLVEAKQMKIPIIVEKIE